MEITLNEQQIETLKQLCEQERSNDNYSASYRAIIGGISDKLFALTKEIEDLDKEGQELPPEIINLKTELD